MEFGMQFFPDVGPEVKAADRYFAESLHLCELCDELGYTHVRTVEHYFQRLRRLQPQPDRVPHRGRAAHRSARAWSPARCCRCSTIRSSSRARSACSTRSPAAGWRSASRAPSCRTSSAASGCQPRREPRALRRGHGAGARSCSRRSASSSSGQFHSFENVTSLPRPTQKPRPPFWVAALGTPRIVRSRPGKAGYIGDGDPAGRRQDDGAARRSIARRGRRPGIPARASVMLAFHMYCRADARRQPRIAREPLNALPASRWSTPPATWTDGLLQGLPGYDKIIARPARRDVRDRRSRRAPPGSATPERDRASRSTEYRASHRRLRDRPRCRSISTRSRTRRPSARCACSPRRSCRASPRATRRHRQRGWFRIDRARAFP